MMAGTKFNSIWRISRRAYGTNYVETLRVQIHANCRIRRVYFSDRLYSEEELPAEFKLYLPVQQKQAQQHGGIAVPQHHQKPESTGELEMQAAGAEV